MMVPIRNRLVAPGLDLLAHRLFHNDRRQDDVVPPGRTDLAVAHNSGAETDVREGEHFGESALLQGRARRELAVAREQAGCSSSRGRRCKRCSNGSRSCR